MAGDSSDFERRTMFLQDEVGYDDLVMGIVVDQPYAQDQHETLHYRHRLGRAKYLGGPLMENAFGLVGYLAARAITNEGSDLRAASRDVADQLNDMVESNAPVDTGRLSESGAPYVDDNGARIYSRPPLARREAGEVPGNGR